MTVARSQLVDTAVTRWYHCITRCVRRAFLLGEGERAFLLGEGQKSRKQWIEHRLQAVANIFAVSVGGFSVLDNHLHLFVRIDPEVAGGWSDGV